MVRIFNVTSTHESDAAMNEFRSAVGEKPTVAAFYMDGCIHCEQLTGPWTAFEKAIEAKHSDDDAVVAFVHKDVAPMIADRVNGGLQMQGYPTIMGFSETGAPTEFEGARNEADLMAFYERIVHGSDKKGGRKGMGVGKGVKGTKKTRGKKGGRNGVGKGTKGAKKTRGKKGGRKGVGKGVGTGVGKGVGKGRKSARTKKRAN